MQAVVPAAGTGTRLRPLTTDVPKPLVEAAGRPLLAHVFDALLPLGVTEYVVVIGRQGDRIHEHFGDRYGDVPITYVRQEESDGLARAVLAAEPHVDGDFMVMNGDNVFRANLAAVLERHRRRSPDATLLTATVSRAQARTTGVFEFEGAEPVGVVEKPNDPPSTTVTTGFAVFSPALFHACRLVTPSERGEYELTDAVDLLLYTGRPVELVPLVGWRINVNTPADRDAVERRLQR